MTTQKHPFDLETLQDYFDGRLSDFEAASVRTHLETCDQCRDVLEGWGAIRGLVAAHARASQHSQAPGAWAAIESAMGRPIRPLRIWEQLLPAAAALAFFALLVQLLRTPVGTTSVTWDYLSFQSADARTEWAAQVAPHPEEQIAGTASAQEGM